MALVAACSAPEHLRTVSVQELEDALSGYPEPFAQILVSSPEKLGSIYRPLGPRLGLIVVSNADEFGRLATSAVGLGRTPDFSRGKMIGVASLAGESIDGEWPIRLEDVQLRQGAGLVSAHFHSGTYLADGLAHADLAFVRNLEAVLIVDINGIRYYP